MLILNALASQFQLPVVFYVISFIHFNINAVSSLVLVPSWFFAFSRWAHVVIHVSSNYVSLRTSVSLLSAVTLLILFGVTVTIMANLAYGQRFEDL